MQIHRQYVLGKSNDTFTSGEGKEGLKGLKQKVTYGVKEEEEEEEEEGVALLLAIAPPLPGLGEGVPRRPDPMGVEGVRRGSRGLCRFWLEESPDRSRPAKS